ncbi:YadA-like family protein [Histophilus somni]|uniref:YadA-like family protein n=1 Tax=Histophilus somni TaxID=731 RepID=UPI00201EDC56|nr:YadA-like family protein [Histophilus somni]
MNKIFKTKYDVTTGQTKVVSELANNRQVASRVEAAGSQPKCGGFLGNFLRAFKVLPLALVAMHCQVSYATLGYLVTDHDTGASGVGTDGRNQWSEAPNWKDKENVIFAPISKDGQNSDKRFVKGVNTNIYQSVIIGPKAAGRNAPDQKNNTSVTGGGMTVVGYNAIGWQSQATAIGNNVYAAGQGTALGSDVMAAGYSSIAIGNDDIAKKYQDKLPEKTIKQIYGYDHSTIYVGDTYKNIMTEEEFKKKYLIYQNDHQRIDNRIYSPTYSAGIGAIAIGSRSVAYGNASLSIGTLSFALADESTALGVRAFVDTNAEGGVAIGDESRVFAPNSFAIGNKAESTSQGSLSFGSNAKAVGQGSIAIGPSVASNAKLSGDGDEQFAEFIMRHTETAAPNIIDNGNNSADITYGADNGKELKFGNDSIVVKSGFAAHRTENKITTMIDKVIAEKEKKLSYSYDKRNEKLETTEKIYTTEQEGDHAISLGYHISNNGNNTITIGSASVVRGANSVVLGALNNVGKYATNTIAFGIGTNVYKENSIAIGTGVNVAGAGVVAIGSGVGVTKDNTISIGYGSHGLSGESIVLGNDASLKDHASKSIVIGHHAQVENKLEEQAKQEKIEKVKRDKGIFLNGNVELEMSAIAIGADSKVYAEKGVAFGNNAQVHNGAIRAMALGNDAEATLKNSVALGYQSTTKYFYSVADKTTATLFGDDASKLPGYIPEGSSYRYDTQTSDGIISVGGWDRGSNQVGLRRIVGVAPGALDSDVATVGQLRALQYVRNEGIVTYYTVEDGKNIKLVKDSHDGKFYRVNTKDGQPMKKLGAVDASKVLVGAKGNEEKNIQHKGKDYVDIGDKIKFGHIADAAISDSSDEAVTGAQLFSVKEVLGVGLESNNTKLKKPTFVAVEYIGSDKGVNETFREVIEDTISAINSGYKFSDEKKDNTPFYLGSTIKIVAGDIPQSGNSKTKTHLGKNLKTQFTKEDSNATAKFTIGLKEDPSFKKVTIEDTIEDKEANKKLAVNKEYVDNKLKNVSANLHFLSVQGNNKAAGNYNNDGAKGTHSVAIGVGARTESGANAGIAIGHNAQSKAENAVVIGRDVSIDVKNSFVLGSNNTVTQSFKDTNGAVVVIGSGTKLVDSKSSIAIGAVYKVHKGKEDGTLIENAAWTASIGNKNKIKNGTDIVALGNNIQALDKTDEMSSNGTKNANTDLILIGNGAIAETAKESVLIGAKSKAETGAKSAVIIGHSAKAEASAVGAVAIGQGATVKTAAGNSIALGQGSEATKKETAPSEASSSNSVKFKWTAGVGASKSVVSLGNKGKERQIKHVAAGAVDKNSTDAINGSQLYAVADEFSKLAVNVLGAEVETDSNKTGFKKSKFEVAKYSGHTDATTPAEMTFKDAIGQNTTAINKGFIFGVGDSTNEQGTHYLGDKLIIKAGNIDKPKDNANTEEGYSSNNIKTHYEKSNKNILIGIKDKPTFKNVIIENGIPDDTSAAATGKAYDNYAVNKKYLDKRLENVGSNFTVKGDTPKDGKNTSLEINKDNNVLTINGDSNITTAVDKDSKKLTVSLNKALTGIKTIELKDDNGSHSKTIAINNKGDLVVVREDNGKKQDVENKIITEKNIGNQTITYKSNGGNKTDQKDKEFKVKLSEGFDFHKSENITVEIEDNGKITHKLNNNLKEIDSIQSGKDAKGAKISFTSTNPTNNSNEVKDKIEFTLGNTNGGDPTKFTFSEAGLDLGNKQIKNIASGIGMTTSTAGGAATSNIEKVLSGNLADSSNGKSANDISNNAVNVKDLSDVAKAIIGKGLTFKGNELTEQGQPQTLQEATLQLGGTVAIESSESVNGKSKDSRGQLSDRKENDIKISVKPSDTNNSKDKVTLTLELNKATSVKEDDERVVTSSAVANEFSKINKTIKDKADAGLKFKGNDNKEIHKKLSDTLEIVGKGLNKNQTAKFKGTDGNIAVINNKQNKLEISLNRDLKGIKSISDSKNKNIATEIRFNRKNDTNSIPNSLTNNLTISSNGGTFEFNRTGLHINNKQITGLRSGLLEKHTGNDSERKGLDDLIGKNFDKSSIKTHAVNVGDLAKISKEIVEKGYKYVADIPSNNGNATSIELGSTISIVKWTDTPASGTGQPAVTVGTGTTSQTQAVKYTGDNLTTRYTYDGGNAKIEIGFNESPTFKAVMLAENQTYNGGNAVDGKELITKGYLEQALDKFKFKVENGSGQAVEIGRGDTLKFTNGQNIQLTLAKQDGTTSASNSSATTPVTPVAAATSPAPAAPAPSAAPSSSSGDADAGSGSTTTATTGGTGAKTATTPTTAVLNIATTSDLSNISSISSPPKGANAGTGGSGSAGGNGTDTEVTKLTLEADNGATFKFGNQGAKVNINDKGIALMPQRANSTGGSSGADPFVETASITINAGSKPVDPNSLESFEEGQEPSITFSTKKTSDGKSSIGSGKITGLADIKPEEKDGTLAANKNYVDEKASDLNNNRPFDFYLGNEKVVKDKDGNFKKLKDGKADQALTEEEKKQVVIKAEPSTAPIGINNVASGLGISAIEESEKQSLTKTIEEKKAELEKTDTALQTAKDQVGEKQKALEEKTNALSQVASERPALLMQKAEIEQQLKGLGASDPRRATAQAELDKVKEALTQNDQKVTEATKTANEASEALKQAKVALADNVLKAYAAQQALATAEETLRNKEFGVDKVKDLLSGNSNIAEDNVATIKDVKALAKAGLSFEGNDGKRLHKDLSETLAIKGEENASGDKFNSDHTAAGNIKVEMAQDGKGLEVKLSDQLKNLTSVETKKDDQGRSTTLLSRGVMVQNDTTKEQAQFSENRLAFFKDGALGLNLDGKSRALKVGEKAIISINDKGEALVSDLNEFSSGMTITNKNYVDTKNNELRTQLNNTDRTLRAGIAGSNAAAGLASVSMPGKSMLAISAAGYGGENAVAIGYSRMSDNGKIMLQLQGNRNSRGKAAGSVSIGYQW